MIPAKQNVLAKGPTAAMIEAARGDRKEEWESNSGAAFHMSNSRAGMIGYKRAPAVTTNEVADGTILPVDGFGAAELRWTWTSPVLRPSQ